MELVAVELFNFRQFEAVDGKPQRIEFARPGKRNVTAIYGTNGAGKSGLLNAFTWCLFGKATKALKHPASLVNHAALASAKPGQKVSAYVKLEFRAPVGNKSTLHTVKRSIETTPDSAEATGSESDQPPAGKVVLTYPAAGQGTFTLDNPDEVGAYLNRLLPSDLFQYFFIDGERIANLTKPENAAEVRHAVEVFVGLKEYLDGSKHLLEAERIFAEEAQQHEQDNAAFKQLCQEIVEKEQLVQDLDQRIKAALETIVELEKNISQIDDKLNETKGVEELENKRKDLQSRLRQLTDDLKQQEHELYRLVLTDGWVAFALDAAENYLSSDLEMRKRGDLPYRIRQPFLKELLERLTCICGRSLDPAADDEHKHDVAQAIKEIHNELAKADLSEVQQQLFGATTAASEVVPARARQLEQIAAGDHRIEDLASRIELEKKALEDVER